LAGNSLKLGRNTSKAKKTSNLKRLEHAFKAFQVLELEEGANTLLVKFQPVEHRKEKKKYQDHLHHMVETLSPTELEGLWFDPNEPYNHDEVLRARQAQKKNEYITNKMSSNGEPKLQGQQAVDRYYELEEEFKAKEIDQQKIDKEALKATYDYLAAVLNESGFLPMATRRGKTKWSKNDINTLFDNNFENYLQYRKQRMVLLTNEHGDNAYEVYITEMEARTIIWENSFLEQRAYEAGLTNLKASPIERIMENQSK